MARGAPRPAQTIIVSCRSSITAFAHNCASSFKKFSGGSSFGELASIVDDLSDYTSKVAMALGIVEVTELGRSLVQACVGR